MEKEDALNQLHMEKHQRADAEQKCVQLNSKIVEVESRHHELQDLKHVCHLLLDELVNKALKCDNQDYKQVSAMLIDCGKVVHV
jgi:hypothetical protein